MPPSRPPGALPTVVPVVLEGPLRLAGAVPGHAEPRVEPVGQAVEGGQRRRLGRVDLDLEARVPAALVPPGGGHGRVALRHGIAREQRQERPLQRVAAARQRRSGSGRLEPLEGTGAGPVHERGAQIAETGLMAQMAARRGHDEPGHCLDSAIAAFVICRLDAQDGLGRPAWLDHVVAEQKAVREAVGIFDQTSFGKLLVQGRDALAVLQRLCARDLDVPVGTMVYTALLNKRGGFESDLTILRQAGNEFLAITGTAQAVRDRSRIARHIGEANATVADRIAARLGPAGPPKPARDSH